MSTAPTSVELEIYVEEGSGNKFAHLYDNGLATVPVTVFYKVTNGTADEVGLAISTPVTSLNQEPTDMSDTFVFAEAPDGSVSGDYDGHYQNGDQAVLPAGENMSSVTFFVSAGASVASDSKCFLMAYVKVLDFRATVGDAPKEAYIYSNMMYDSIISNNDSIELITTHKPTIDLTVVKGSTPEHTYEPSNFNWSNGFFVKASYSDVSLDFKPRSSAAMFYKGTDDEIVASEPGNATHLLESEPGFCAAVAAETDKSIPKWLSRCVSNGVNVSGYVNQNGSSDGQARYNFSMSAPFVGSFATFCVDHLGDDVYDFHQYEGKATFYIEDAYGSKSELFAIPTTRADDQTLLVDTTRVDIIHT